MKRKSELYGIIGLGRFGFALAQTLANAGKDVLVVDNNEAKIKEAAAFTDNAFTVGELNAENLQDAGIRNCDTVIVCIGEQIDTSILTTLTVLRLGVKKVISKAINPEQGSVLEMLGAEVVYPERDMAIRLANRLISPRILEYISLSDEVDITEINLTDKADNMTVAEMDIRKKYGLNIIAIKRNNEINTDIQPELTLNREDIIVVIGKKEKVRMFESYLNE
jgi:trk system potassium uptake protein TrkA